MEDNNYTTLREMFNEYWLLFALVITIFAAVNSVPYALIAAMLFVSYYCVDGYWTWAKLSLGMMQTSLTVGGSWSNTAVLYSFVYTVITIVGFFTYPMWAMFMAPWIIHLSVVNFIAFMVHKGIFEFGEVEGDDEEDDL